MKRQFQIAFSVALVLLATIVLSSCTGVTGRVDNPISPSLTVKVESATIQVGKTCPACYAAGEVLLCSYVRRLHRSDKSPRAACNNYR